MTDTPGGAQARANEDFVQMGMGKQLLLKATRLNFLFVIALLVCFFGTGCGITNANSTGPGSTIAPSITTQPASQTVTAGNTATFTVAAAGTSPFTYQWRKNMAAINGATSTSYTTPATTSADNGAAFDVVVTNSAASTTSMPATLTVDSAPVAPSITTQPANQTVTAGQTATFSVMATGTAPLSYQWQKNNVAISGATMASYTTPATTTADSGSSFSVIVTNPVKSITSAGATLTVNTASVAPSITTQPANQTVTAGQTATFSVVATGTAPLSYQWQKNGAAISGATMASYTTPATTTADSGSSFSVVVTNSVKSITSASATLTVNKAPVAPSITTQPANQTVTAGQTATFSVVASGTAPLSYQWQKNSVAISGATMASYTTPATTTADSGTSFSVVVTNPVKSITSASATLTVNPDTTPPTVSITSPAANATVSGTITVTATASDNVGVASVQLQVDGANLGVPDNTAPYTFLLDTTAFSNGSHSLTAVAKDTSGNSATSAPVSITVSNQTTGARPTYAGNGAGMPISNDAKHLSDRVTSYTAFLPNPTISGNTLILWLRYKTASETITFTDNIGGNAYTAGPCASDSTNGHTLCGFYVSNVEAGVTSITVHFTTATQYVQLQPYEFYNVGALDASAANTGTGTSVTSNSTGALSASNDLVFQAAVSESVSKVASCFPASQANISWTLREAMLADDYPSCTQFGVYTATAPFQPQIDFASTIDYMTLTMAFKAASAGAAPPSGIRVVYVQHDNTSNEQDTTVPLEYPVSGNVVAVLFTSGCAGTSSTDCAYAKGLSDGTNAYSRVGPTVTSNFGSDGGNSSGQAWYAKVGTPGTYLATYTMNPRSSGGNGNSFFMYDIAGASSNPLDTVLGGAGTGLASTSFDQASSGSGGPTTTLQVTVAAPNEVILSTIGAAWDTFTGLSSPSGAQFLSCNYVTETNSSHCDLNGGWGLFYNGASTTAETWTWTHDTSNFAGVGAGVGLAIAFQAP